MTNQSDAPAHLDRALNVRLQNSDKQDEIELYYALLSAGHSVGEILNSVGSVQSRAGHGHKGTAEPPQSGPDPAESDGAMTDAASESALAEADSVGPAGANLSAIREAADHASGRER